MTTACIVLAGVMHCITSTAPRVTAAEAAAILAPHQFTLPAAPDVPGVIIVTGSAGSPAGGLGLLWYYRPYGGRGGRARGRR